MIKVVVTTHVNYSKAMQSFIRSVDNNKDSALIYNRLIVVVNGSERDDIEVSPNGLVTIQTPLNVWEYTAFVQLEAHKDHPKVYSEYYFLLHDTCMIGASFFDKLLTQEAKLKKQPYAITHCHLPSSNIVIIHKDIVYDFARSVTKIQNKWDGCLIEQGLSLKDGTMSFYRTTRSRRIAAARKEIRPYDVYKTGHARKPFYYPEFDVMKYILWDYEGDFTNDVQRIRPIRT